MIISDDSPLRMIPSRSSVKQALFLDGIRYAVDMTDHAHCRLIDRLVDFDQAFRRNSNVPDGGLVTRWHVPIFLDAWSIVDSVHRLRRLLDRMPGLRKRDPGYQVFNRQTAVIDDLRNSIQHLETEIDHLVRDKLPVWGAIGWVCMSAPGAAECSLYTMVAGSANWQMAPLVNPLGKGVGSPVDLITLWAAGLEVGLSHTVGAVGKLVAALENHMRQEFNDLSKRPADVSIRAGLQFGQRPCETR